MPKIVGVRFLNTVYKLIEIDNRNAVVGFIDGIRAYIVPLQ